MKDTLGTERGIVGLNCGFKEENLYIWMLIMYLKLYAKFFNTVKHCLNHSYLTDCSL